MVVPSSRDSLLESYETSYSSSNDLTGPGHTSSSRVSSLTRGAVKERERERDQKTSEQLARSALNKALKCSGRNETQ